MEHTIRVDVSLSRKADKYFTVVVGKFAHEFTADMTPEEAEKRIHALTAEARESVLAKLDASREKSTP